MILGDGWLEEIKAIRKCHSFVSQIDRQGHYEALFQNTLNLEVLFTLIGSMVVVHYPLMDMYTRRS